MTPGSPRISRLVLLILRPVHWILMTFYFRVTICHADRLPLGVPIILAPTHRSKWDSAFLKKLLGYPPYYLVNEGNYHGFQGWLLRRMGCIAINLAHPSHHSLNQCTTLVESGQPLVIFPEATIYYYPPNHVHVPLTPGVAWVSLMVAREMAPNAPLIVPIRLNYSDLQLKFRSRIEIVVMPPIDSAAFVNLPKKEGRQKVTEILQSQLGDVGNDSNLERFPATEFLKEKRRMLRTEKNF